MRKPPAFLSRHIFFLNLFSAIAFSQGIPLSTDSSGQRDSSLSIQDSVLVDTLAAPDLPGKLARAFSRESGTATSISRTDLQWFGHRYAGEIIGQVPGAYLRDPGVEGQYSQINFRGSDWRSVAVLADGRLLNDPATGTYNLYYYATDYLDHVEIVSGPRSFLYGMNAAGGSIHFVSRNLDTNRPLSRINYTEGPHGYGSVDGTIAQNVAERTNVTLGFQRQVADGRYDNSAHEAWNLRAKVRHAFTDRLFLVLSEYYTGTKTQLNGGIAPDAASLENAFFPLETSVRNGDSYEKVNRHDIDISLVGFFLSDSSSPTRLSFFYSHNLREYRDETGGEVPNNLFIQSDHRSSWMGSSFSQDIAGSFHRLDIDATLEIRQIEGSPNLGRRRNVFGSVSAKEELNIAHTFTVAAYGRYDRYLNEDYTGFGADASVSLWETIKVFGGASFSRRMPNYQELYWTDSTVSRSPTLETEEHRHVEIGAEVSLPELGTIRATYFHRRVVHPIIVEPFGTGNVYPGMMFTTGAELVSEGIDVRLSIPVWKLTIEGTGSYLLQRANNTTVDRYPRFFASGGIFFMDRLIDDHLHLKTGIQGRYQSNQLGSEFNAEVVSYVDKTGIPIDGGGAIDFLLIAGIGDAYVHFVWENLMESEYFATPYYPVKDRAIRFGIAWQFLD